MKDRTPSKLAKKWLDKLTSKSALATKNNNEDMLIGANVSYMIANLIRDKLAYEYKNVEYILRLGAIFDFINEFLIESEDILSIELERRFKYAFLECFKLFAFEGNKIFDNLDLYSKKITKEQIVKELNEYYNTSNS
jgi:hypothetical protein